MRNRLTYFVRVLELAARHPSGALGRLRGALDKRCDRTSWAKLGVPPRDFYGVSYDWQERFHKNLGERWPCETDAEFDPLWSELAKSLGARGRGIALPFDPFPEFARAAWCATRHLRPARSVETGVARGITSRILLTALERNQEGHLWSIDLPHPENAQPGVAVPASLRRRWTLLLGPSSSRLPPLLSELGEIDLFLHDSLHTGRNVQFELISAWRHLRPGGIVLADDLHQSLGLHRFVKRTRPELWLSAPRNDGGVWGLARKAA